MTTFINFFNKQCSWVRINKFCTPIAILFFTLATIVGCASEKATLQAPELPAKHWLEEVPGVPVEHAAKLQAAVPNLYDSQKAFTFEDCVYLTIQQSPMLVNSAVDLEIQKVNLTDAIWQYLPEPNLSLQLSNNITSYNTGLGDTPKDYGQPKMQVSFDAAFPNPLATYFNHQAQQIMVNLAIATHRKAIGSAINDIAGMYQRLEAQRQIIEVQKELIPLSKKLTAYWQQLESVDGRQGVSRNLAVQREREAELTLERTEIENLMLRTKLKTLAGVEIQQKLNLDTKDADSMLAGFDGNKLHWEDRWNATEDELLVRAQLKLRDFGIMLAWAEYVPDMTIQVNNSPPAGQYNPPDGREDTFVHFYFDFPLLDWGRRYRGVQTARMQKALAFQEQARMRNEYSNKWIEAQQNLTLAETSLKIAQTNLEVARMEAKEAEINFQEGIAAYPVLAGKQEALINARINYINAELDYKLAKLSWMDVAGILKERYIGKPAAEVI